MSDEADEMGAGSGYQKPLDVLGSGFIVDPAGVVLTNMHVVKGAARLVVQTADGEQFSVKNVNIDREYDAAVLRIEADAPLPFVRLGDSDAAEIGDWVLTIGSPLELDQTVSAGIITPRTGRSVQLIRPGTCRPMPLSIREARAVHSCA